jgi:hypothetical protein
MTSLHPVNVAVDDQLPHPDTLVLHNRPLRPGTDPAFLSVFADDRWVLTPAFFEEHQQAVSLNLAALPPRFQAAAKHYLWQQLNHPEPPVLPGSSTRHLAVRTVASGFQHLAAFLHWLDARAVARVADITSADLDTYLGHLLAAAVSTGTLFERVQEVRRLWAWRGRLPADARLPEEPPWRGDSPSAIVGRRRDHGQENRTARIHPATMDRLLGWALRLSTCSPMTSSPLPRTTSSCTSGRVGFDSETSVAHHGTAARSGKTWRRCLLSCVPPADRYPAGLLPTVAASLRGHTLPACSTAIRQP